MYFLTFGGYGHSGHTLVAAILASHPQVLISNTYGRQTKSIDKLVKEATGKGNKWGYRFKNFVIDGQRRYSDLRVIGHTSVGRKENLWFPDGLERKRIVVIRNPWDTLNAYKHPAGHIDTYKRGIEEIEPGEKVIYLEDMIEDPTGTLTTLLGYLNIDYDPKWVEARVKLVWKKPKKNPIKVNSEGVRKINRLINDHEWLSRYA